MKLTEITAYNNQTHKILNEALNESFQELTEGQIIYLSKWETNVWPLVEQYNKLMEAQLTVDQVQAIFKNAEKVSIEGGENLTALGKAGKVTAEVSGKMKTEIEKLIKQAAESGPVKNFDQQFEKLKAQLKTKVQKVPGGQKILQGVEKWGDFAKENPGKSAFIIGAMTSVLAFASGGILSGAAIGFFLKLANNTIKGDKLSVAMAKGVKGAAIGAIAGALGQAISSAAEDLFPAEITNVFTNQDGEIDISKLSALNATSVEDIDAEAAKDLIQTRMAMEEMIPRLSGEEQEILQQQMKVLNDKIFDLGGEPGGNLKGAIDNLQDKFGIEGRGVDIVVKTNTDAGGDIEVDAEGTVKAEYSAKELNDEFGVDASEFPRNAWLDDNKEALMKIGMTDEEFESLQQATQLNRAVEQTQWREGTSISASNELKTFSGVTPKVMDGVEGEYVEGEEFTSRIETKFPGSDKPWSANVTTSIEGEDADGNVVYTIKKVSIGPEIFNDKMFAAIDKLAEQDPDNPLVKEFTQKVLLANPSADMETIKDTFAQDMAEKVMGGAAAVALGGALAQSEVKPAKEKKESRQFKNREQLEDQYFDLLEDYYLSEIGIKDIAKNAAKGAANIGKAAAKGAGKAVGTGMDKVGGAAQSGLGKAFGAIAKGAKAVGTELGQKITARKLNRAWEKAGSPMDTGSVANILSQAGMSDEQIGLVGKEQNLDLKPGATTKTDQDATKDKTTQTGTGGVDLKTLADEIKKAGVADQVKKTLSQEQQQAA